MPLIAITRLRLRFHRYLPSFIFYTLLSTWQAQRAPGNLGISLLIDANRTYWTRTAWQSETAMYAFRQAASHGQAMLKLIEWCDEASAVHWIQETPDLPGWDEAHRRMLKEGHRSPVRHPSAAHIADEIAAPKTIMSIF
ncbi:hypothetical protein [Calothrix sp. PCC 7507]|uniref:hypothetical protein n=1 Tax=Calothrix sp. PCC 7507 TaxID=99598 RepID=UPI00029EE74D|nr:hypothetical protein [Calothrix sp. PCC 7507]AFY35829.1 hypothetical protein Cal7507_5498 [Calothrix sp. PCC 7507]